MTSSFDDIGTHQRQAPARQRRTRDTLPDIADTFSRDTWPELESDEPTRVMSLNIERSLVGACADGEEVLWMVRNGDQEVGPVSTELLIAGVAAGRVPPSSEVRRWVKPVWRPLSDIPPLAAVLRSDE